MSSWILLAPEYPPATGGIADYLEQLGAELVKRGDEVDIFSPAPAQATPNSGARVRELPHGYAPSAWREIAALARARPDAVTVLEYIPLTFLHPLSLAALLRWPGPLWVMFHESAYPFERGQHFRHRVLAVGTHLAASALVRRADRVLVSTPGCETALQMFTRRTVSAIWSPIPSNLVPPAVPRARAEVLREFGLDPERPVVGHFSAFGGRVAELLQGALALLFAAEPRVQALLVGQGSEAFRERLVQAAPEHAERVRAGGRVTSERAADAIGASDVLLFPYPDGVSSRRTTVMAGLSFGKPIVTTTGANTESVWGCEDCVELCSLEPAALADAVRRLLADSTRRAELGARAERVYRERFSFDRVVEALRGLRRP